MNRPESLVTSSIESAISTLHFDDDDDDDDGPKVQFSVVFDLKASSAPKLGELEKYGKSAHYVYKWNLCCKDFEERILGIRHTVRVLCSKDRLVYYLREPFVLQLYICDQGKEELIATSELLMDPLNILSNLERCPTVESGWYPLNAVSSFINASQWNNSQAAMQMSLAVGREDIMTKFLNKNEIADDGSVVPESDNNEEAIFVSKDVDLKSSSGVGSSGKYVTFQEKLTDEDEIDEEDEKVEYSWIYVAFRYIYIHIYLRVS